MQRSNVSKYIYLISRDDRKILFHNYFDTEHYGDYGFCNLEDTKNLVEFKTIDDAQKLLDNPYAVGIGRERKRCHIITVIKQPKYIIVSIKE
jgi:hypothetical protein